MSSSLIRKLTLVFLGLLVTAVFALTAVGYLKLPFLQLLENVSYDIRVQLTTADETDPRVVIVDIDENSLVAEGRWPWRRDKIARLIEQLVNTYQVEIVAFDMVFAEKERNFSIDQLRELATVADDNVLVEKIMEYEPYLDRDAILAETIASTGRVVLGYYFHHQKDETNRTGELPESLFPASSEIQNTTYAVQANGYAGNLGVLQESSLGAGFFSNPVVDDDGVYRRVPLLVEYNGDMYTSLALAIVQSYIGIPAEPVFAPGGEGLGDCPALEGLDLGGILVPLDANATALVPYQGPEGTFAYVSATKVLNGTVEEPDRFAGTIVLIGTTAAGLVDLRPTPVQNVYPGVEVHANLIVGMMDGAIKRQPAYTIAVELLMVIIAGTLLAVLLPLIRPLFGAFCTILAMAAISVFNIYAWSEFHHVLPFASPLSVIVLIYVLNTIYGFFFEARSRSQLGRLFGQYVPRELVDEMSRNPGNYSLAGEKRELTVLFSDVRNFTTISEAMDPKELTQMMNSFLTPLTRSVHEHKGTIDKYMGDALMAFWGAPLADPKHASEAVATALEMTQKIEELQDSFKQAGWQEIRVGIGINTGEMSVGNMGSEFRIAYTVMGDAVNLGSRLEGLTKQYGVQIVVSEYTVEQAPEFLYIELDQVRVKGKLLPVSIHTPLGLVEQMVESEVAFAGKHAAALMDYRCQHFEQARLWFSQPPEENFLTPLYELYCERIDSFLQHPPGDDWDGVFTFETK